MANYVWVTDPPVSLVPSREFAPLIERLRTNVRDYGNPEASGTPEYDEARKALEACEATLDAMRAGLTAGESECYAYLLDEAPIALMMLRCAAEVTIAGLAAHPGGQDADTIMVEFAANRSREVGRGGRLTVDTAREPRAGFWEMTGFTPAPEPPAQGGAGGGGLRLDPLTTEKWVLIGGKLRLKEFAAAPSYSTTAD